MSVRRRQIAERIEFHITYNLAPGYPRHADAVQIKRSGSRMGRYLRYRERQGVAP